MYLSKENLNELIKIENKLARVKKYYNEFCTLSTIIEELLQKRANFNKNNYNRIKEKRKTNKNYAREKNKKEEKIHAVGNKNSKNNDKK